MKINFISHVDIPHTSARVSYGDTMMTIGSCFAENIGKRLCKNKFAIDLNPFGVLYNPASVAQAIRSLLQPVKKKADTLFFHEGLFHSFEHHGCFSGVSETDCLRKINTQLHKSASNILTINYLFVTFGSASYFRFKENGMIVANCHKLPDRFFVHEKLTINAITDEWDELLSALWAVNKAVKVIFTVSPIRHWKDGAHENQLSKSILLLAVDMLKAHHPDKIFYFPAYEIMLDELRDYRFYADDLFHPSEMAVEYIFERFAESFMDAETRLLLAEVDKILKSLTHKPLCIESEAYKHFLKQTLLKMEQIMTKTPYICFAKEIETIKLSVRDTN